MKRIACLALAFFSFSAFARTRSTGGTNDRAILGLELAPVSLSFAHWTVREANTPLLLEDGDPNLEQLQESFEDATSRVRSEQKKNKVSRSSLENLLAASTSLVETLEDIHLKRFKNRQLTDKEQGLYEVARKEKETTLNSLLRMSKNREDSAKYRFQLAAMQPSSAESQKAFLQLVKENSIDPSLKRRAQSQILINLLSSRELIANKSKLMQILKTNKNIFENNSISTKIVLWLAATRATAGISGADKITVPSADWIKYLKETLEATSGIDHKYRDQVVMDLLFVWRKVQTGGLWRATPIDEKLLARLSIYPAILERRSLEIYALGNILEAIKLTREIEDRVENKVPFRTRLLNWHNAYWTKTGKYTSYEAEITRQIEVEKDATRQKDPKDHYLNLVRAEHKSIKKSPGQAKSVIALSDRFIASTSPANDLKANILELTAQAYLAADDQRSAARRFGLAAETISDKGQKVRLYRAAVQCQRKVAKWTEAPPWFKSVSHDSRVERESLQKFHLELLALQPSSWDDAAHAGLLYLDFLDQKSAFTLWREQIKKYPSGTNPNNAAWVMLAQYEKEKNWDELETFARMLESVRLNPLANGKKLSANDKLALALYEGGMMSFQEKKYEKSILKLQEYVDRWSRPDEDKALWSLSLALNFDSRTFDAVKRCLELVNRFKNSAYYMPANWQGYEWSENMALENNMVIFANNYLGRERQTSKAMALRTRLIGLYLGLEQYGDVLSQLQEQQASYRTNKIDDTSLLYQIMTIQNRFGKPANAISAANAVLAKSKVPEHLAEALGIKGLALAQQNDIKSLAKVEKQIADLPGEGFIFTQKRAKIRLRIAQSISTKFILEPVINITLKNPSQTMQTKFDAFNAYLQRMRLVCAPGRTGYCALALINIRNLGRDFLKVLEDININPKLGDQDTKPFEALKKDITSRVSGYIDSSEKEAYQIVTDGETDPATALEVMSSVSNDWNFEPITGSEGKGFVQLQLQKGAAK